MTKDSRPSIHRIVWAVNPFDRNPKLNQSMFKLLRNLEKIPGTSIEPVFVKGAQFASVSDSDISLGIQKLIKQSRLKAATTPVILTEPAHSQKAEVRRLLSYCDETKVSLIAIATHARKGLQRFILGSFAETLLLLASVPLVFVNHHKGTSSKIKKVFFTTDLGEQSEAAASWVIDATKALNARLQIYSVLQTFKEGVLLTQDVGGVAFPLWITTSAAESRGKKLQALAKEKDVTADFTYEKGTDAVLDLILRRATRSKADIIFIAAESRRTLPTMIGSMTRQLVRQAPCPILIFRP